MKLRDKFLRDFSKRIIIDSFTEAQIIQHVNAIPGAGKTYTWIHEIAVPHVKDQHNSLLVYAAPTEALLKQVERDLIDAGIPTDAILRLSSKTLKRANIVEDFRAAVAYESSGGRPNGTIILCTHECIARLPVDMPNKNRVALVYDEARECLQEGFLLKFPAVIYDYFTKVRAQTTTEGHLVRVPLIQSRVVSAAETDTHEEDISLWQWSNARIPLPSIDDIRALLPASSKRETLVSKIIKFIANIQSSSLDVYVSVKKVRGKAEYQISNVYSPARMFRNYAKVLILSAFFESSQMYHFLSDNYLFNQIDTQFPIRLEDVTRQYIDSKRMVNLLRRLRNVYLTYIFDLDGKILSKTAMQNGIVIKSKIDDDFRKELNRKWQDCFGENRAESYRTVYDHYVKLPWRARNSLDDSRVKQYDLLDQMAGGIHGGVIPFMVERAIYLQQAFFKWKGMPDETLPVCVNPRFRSYLDQKESIWSNEELDYLNKRTKLYRVPEDGAPIITKLPIAAHGLNEYQRLHSCAFLASMNYNNDERKFLGRAVSAYDAEADRTIAYALQALWRCKARKVSKDACIMIVSDLRLAERLRARFVELARDWLGEDVGGFLLIRPPERLLTMFSTDEFRGDHRQPAVLTYAYEGCQKDRDQRRKESIAGQLATQLKKIYLKSESGKRCNALTSMIATYRKAGKPTDRLLAERSGLMKFAAWKKSPDGLAAEATLIEAMKPKGKATVDKLLAVFSDSRIWDGNHSGHDLLMIQAAKAYGLSPAAVRRYYPGDGFDKNWSSVRRWDKEAKPANIILAEAKACGIPF